MTHAVAYGQKSMNAHEIHYIWADTAGKAADIVGAPMKAELVSYETHKFFDYFEILKTKSNNIVYRSDNSSLTILSSAFNRLFNVALSMGNTVILLNLCSSHRWRPKLALVRLIISLDYFLPVFWGCLNTTRQSACPSVVLYTSDMSSPPEFAQFHFEYDFYDILAHMIS